MYYQLCLAPLAVGLCWSDIIAMAPSANEPSWTDREVPPFLINYGFEVEFLVAQETHDSEHNTEQSSDAENEPRLRPWACPADTTGPVTAVLAQCRNVLVRKDEAVTIYDTPECNFDSRVEFNIGASGTSPRFGSWALAAASTARVMPQFKSAYRWIGIKLGTPLVPESDLGGRDSQIKWALGLLRSEVRMSVNSTCSLRVFLQPDLNPLNLLMAKKLASLIWVLKKPFLTKLCPVNNARNSSTVASRFALQAPEGIVESRPQDPLIAGIMDQNIPRLVDMRMRVQLHRIWSQPRLECLDKGLQMQMQSETTQRMPSAFGMQALDEPYDDPVLEFQYGVWHPYDTVDTTENWVRLSIALLRATQLSPVHFRGFIGSLDGIIRGWVGASLWQILLSRLGVSASIISDWERISNEYKDGGMLASDVIDCKGRLPSIPELRAQSTV